MGGMLHWDAFFDQAVVPPFDQQIADTDPATSNDLEEWTAKFFEDTVFDWIGFEGQV